MRLAVLVTVLSAALTGAGLAARGPQGAAVVGTAAMLVVAVIARAALPASRRPARPATGDRVPYEFSSYRHLSSMLTWSTSNGHHYDVVTRPMLAATASALLAQRRRIDLGREPARAAGALGGSAWDLLDPNTTHGIDSPVALRDITTVLSALEEL